MLSELFIRDFAIIDELRLRFDPGFNVLTGETGAGKSIILDAVLLVLGGRADAGVVRAGSEESYIEATFRLKPAQQQLLQPILEAEGLDDESGEEIILAREVRLNGRNICRVNGRNVNVALLRQIADPLIDIHGQGDHLSLLQPRSHLPLLDAYGNLTAEREALAAEVGRLQGVQRELAALQRNKSEMAFRLEMLQYKIQEIDALALRADEEESLRVERTRLGNAEQLGRAAAEALAQLRGVDDDTPAVLDLLGKVERALSQLAKLDETRQPLLANAQGLGFQLSELAGEVQDYLDGLEFDPERLNFVEERLETIKTLKRKYAEEDIAGLLAARDRAEEEVKALQDTEVRTAELEARQEELLRTIGRMAQELSQKRRAVAGKLAASVESHLQELKMEGARFTVDFATKPAADGCYMPGESDEARLSFDRTGVDQIEFLISTNPGEPLKPLARVASGGETARLMLALKTALAQVDATPTLIFDEIDQGIGGRVGDIVGRKLWGLSATAEHQVIVVTHLPQLAGYGDAHFQVSKAVNGGRTTTSVQALDMPGRVRELAAMLGTQGVAARDGAESILRQVRQAKSQAALPV